MVIWDMKICLQSC